MNKIAQDQIANHFYNAGVQLALSGRGMEKNAFSMRNAKQVAGGIAGAGVGGAGGLYGGGILGGIKPGLAHAEAIAKINKAGLSYDQMLAQYPEVVAALTPGIELGQSLGLPLGLGLGAYGGQRAVKRLMR